MGAKSWKEGAAGIQQRFLGTPRRGDGPHRDSRSGPGQGELIQTPTSQVTTPSSEDVPSPLPGPREDCPGRTAAPAEGAGPRSLGFGVVPGVRAKALAAEVSSVLPLRSTPSAAHIRVKRYRQMMNPGSRSSPCRLGTCTVQKLAHQIYQLTDKDKDGVAPRDKISAQGYGRRRRRSLREVLRARTVLSSQEQTHAAAASGAAPRRPQAL